MKFCKEVLFGLGQSKMNRIVLLVVFFVFHNLFVFHNIFSSYLNQTPDMQRCSQSLDHCDKRSFHKTKYIQTKPQAQNIVKTWGNHYSECIVIVSDRRSGQANSTRDPVMIRSGTAVANAYSLLDREILCRIMALWFLLVQVMLLLYGGFLGAGKSWAFSFV